MDQPECNDSLPQTGGSWHNLPAAGWFYVVISDTTNPGPRQPVSNWVPRNGLISYGVVLAVLASLVNAVLCLTTLFRKQRCSTKSVTSSSSSWRRLALINFTCVQLAIGLIIVPVKVMTETMAVWTIGPVACRVYLLGQVWLIAETMWSVVLLVFDALIQTLSPASLSSLRYSEYSRSRPRCIAPAAVIVSWLAASTALFPLGVALTNNGDMNDVVLEEVCAISMRREDAVAQAITSFLLPAGVALCGCAALVCRNAAKASSSSDEGGWMSPVSIAVACCALWSPFFALYAALPFCPYDRMCIDPGAWTVLAWLGYSTSFIAPVCWLVCDKDFRSRFLSLVNPKLNRISSSNPALGEHDQVKSGDEIDDHNDDDIMTSVKGTSSERLVVSS